MRLFLPPVLLSLGAGMVVFCFPKLETSSLRVKDERIMILQYFAVLRSPVFRLLPALL